MVKKERFLKIAINDEGIHEVEKFIEEICDDFNIFNSYFGNIMLAVLEACENAFINIDYEETVLDIQFWSEKNKLIFSIKGNNEVYLKKEYVKKLENSDELNFENDNESYLIMKMLADELVYDEKDKSLRIIFYISSINHNLTMNREKILLEYFEKVKKKIKAHDE